MATLTFLIALPAFAEEAGRDGSGGDIGTVRLSSKSSKIPLTEAEKEWLARHPVIRVHNEMDWPPFNYFEYGRPRGLSIDYMNLVAARLGIEVQYVTGPSWNEFLDMVQRQELDVMLNIVRTEERQRFLLFTDPYVQNPNVIVSTIEKPYENIQALFGRTVAFPRGFFFEEVLAKSFPQIKRLPVEDSLASLKAVLFGRADAALAEAAVARTLITKNLLTGLRISGEVDIGNPDLTSMRIGVRGDWPLLHTAIMKAMADVTLEEMTQIRQRWIADEVDTAALQSVVQVSYGRLVAYGLAVFVFLCLLTWVLIRVLKREQVAVHFGSRWFRGLVIAGLSLFVVVVSLLGWFVLERSRTNVLNGVSEDLTETLKVANQKLDLWLAQGTSALRLLGRDPDLVVLTQRLAAVPANRQALAASTALRGLRRFFETHEEMFANSGFYIFDRDNITIGALQDTDLGGRNLIARKRPDLLQRAFAGELLFVPPITADSRQTSGPAIGASGDQSPTFFMGPIREPGGRVLAVMALGVDPSEDLLRLLPFARTRETGETYAFSAEGHLLSESRFEAQLRRIGLIGEDQTSVLNVALKDPGVNLLDGLTPAVDRAEQPLTRMASRAVQIRSAMQQAGQTSGHSKIEIDIDGYRDYRGVPVFGAWLWHASLGVGLATEIDMAETMAAYYQIRWTVFGVLGFTLVLSVGAILMVLILGERASRALLTARDNLEGEVDARTAELQEKQKLLAEAEERARLLLDSAGEGIFGVDAEGKLRFINPAGCRLLGYEPQELIGAGIHAKVHYAHADGSPYPREECPMYRSFTEGASFRITDEVLWRQDGTPFPVEYTSMPVKKDGKVVGAVVTFMDITERKQMEAKLAAEKKRLQSILDTSPVAAGISVEGVIQYANARLAEYFGLKEGDRTFSIYLNPGDRDFVLEALERTGEVRNHELKVYDSKGEVREMLANYNRIEYEGQSAVLGWWTDITDIKATSEALKSKFDELARFRRMAIGRELKMIELKKEINDLIKANGAADKYKIH
ncbi:MAG: transporter substrate-binding domain-containing protein [Desulfobacterales bacterium]|nr:transporter substrate-binding domain-containing protein [Desulfobacterales bacterium]